MHREAYQELVQKNFPGNTFAEATRRGFLSALSVLLPPGGEEKRWPWRMGEQNGEVWLESTGSGLDRSVSRLKVDVPRCAVARSDVRNARAGDILPDGLLKRLSDLFERNGRSPIKASTQVELTRTITADIEGGVGQSEVRVRARNRRIWKQGHDDVLTTDAECFSLRRLSEPTYRFVDLKVVPWVGSQIINMTSVMADNYSPQLHRGEWKPVGDTAVGWLKAAFDIDADRPVRHVAAKVDRSIMSGLIAPPV